MSLDIWLAMPTGNGEELTTQSMNYTHNVLPMWRAAGVAEALYDSHGHQAREYLDVLRAGIKNMEDEPAKYQALNPSNGWGSYDTALPWLREWLIECVKHPDAIIRVSA